MTKIDPVGIIKIVEMLTNSKVNVSNDRKANANRSLAKLNKSSGEKPYSLLQKRIVKVLASQGLEGAATDKVKQSVISEIVLWEFGEEFVNHSEYRQITEYIASVIGSSQLMESAFTEYIRKISDSTQVTP